MVRARAIACHEDVAIAGEWSYAWVAPGVAVDPAGLARLTPAWVSIAGPMPAAAALRAPGAGAAPPRLDGVDWWYRCRFDAPGATKEAGRIVLGFDGLATLTEVWLNGEPLLRSENMFLAHEIDITERLQARNEMLLVCRALDAVLAVRRARPRWRAPMVEHQQLRWFRTTLLGRTPGWSPPLPPIGPWRPVRWQRRVAIDVDDVLLRPTVDGPDGVLAVALTARPLGAGRLARFRLHLEGPGGSREALLAPVARSIAATDGSVRLEGTVRVPDVALWWPHTHGAQPFYRARAVLGVSGASGDREIDVDLGAVGFRTLALDTADGDFALSVNGARIFCRGACWTPLDVATLTGPPDEYRRTLEAARVAGLNMLRVCGAMVYETPLFYDLCDQLGILIWQDFMFANMDYPQDPAFVASVQAEARQALGAWQGRPSLALLCGDSEGEQQAAMWGAPRAVLERPLFRETLPALARELCPDVPYWPSSASGGAFPHEPRVGSTSYYGVGAYLRPLEDARRSEVRFASECLGFANIPEDATLATLAGGAPVRVHTPAWKAGVPRDLGAGWDFDDVRDHYLALLFGVDPVALRSTDPERYLALGRVTSGEVMEAAFAEWRRGRSGCRGALIWFMRDLVAGAGWGLLDVGGRPKAAYHYVKRILQPLAVFFSDEGLNGLVIHAVNDTAAPWSGQVRLALFRDGETPVGGGAAALKIPARGTVELPAASLLEAFWDTTYAYRFGPPAHDLAAVTLLSESGTTVGEAFHFPVGRPALRGGELGLEAVGEAQTTGDVIVTLRTRRFAQAVFIDAAGFEPDDNHFHLAPGATRRVTLRRRGAAGALHGSAQALNARSPSRIGLAP